MGRIGGKWLFASAVALALLVSPFAIAAGEGDPILGGARNPSPNQEQSLTRETEIIATTNSYGTRQSNKSDNGGGAIYGCRSRAGGSERGNEPCIRANNLSNGRSFEFESEGEEAGRIEVGRGGDGVRPFSTDATGVATGLNADRVDGLEGAQIAPRFARVSENGTLQGGRGATGARRTSAGNYSVDFSGDVTNCAYSATQVSFDENNGAVAVEQEDSDTVRVRTRNGGGPEGQGATGPADKPFHLLVFC
jgi:hypothetical protein